MKVNSGCFCDISFPAQKGFLCLFLLYNRHLLCTTLSIWTVFKSQLFFGLREKWKSVLSDWHDLFAIPQFWNILGEKLIFSKFIQIKKSNYIYSRDLTSGWFFFFCHAYLLNFKLYFLKKQLKELEHYNFNIMMLLAEVKSLPYYRGA